MSLSAYTVPLEDGMRVKHGSEARFTVKAGNLVLDDRLVNVGTLNGAITVAGITYNRLSYSGGVEWWNPATGKAIRKPKYDIRLRPGDILTGEEMCNCKNCR